MEKEIKNEQSPNHLQALHQSPHEIPGIHRSPDWRGTLMKDKRIRLTQPDVRMISRALDFYERKSGGEIFDEADWKEKSKTLRDLLRRFHCLCSEDGFTARRSRT